jgi:hypothetical protein
MERRGVQVRVKDGLQTVDGMYDYTHSSERKASSNRHSADPSLKHHKTSSCKAHIHLFRTVLRT